jgi:hypothetical protein
MIVIDYKDTVGRQVSLIKLMMHLRQMFSNNLNICKKSSVLCITKGSKSDNIEDAQYRIQKFQDQL